MKILIVDDLIENLKLLNGILEPFGDCDFAKNGEEALELVTSYLEEGVIYRLIMLDIMMPGMDGQQVLKKIRELEQEHAVEADERSFIIMSTAVDAQTEVTQAFVSGCDEYINKPISRAKLLSKLAEHGLIPDDWWKGRGR